MPLYITLGRWTEQGIKTVKDSPKRVATLKEAIRKAGGKWHALYYTIGPYDFVQVIELPNDEVFASVILNALSKTGTVDPLTLKAFSEEEGYKILAGLP